MDNIDTRQIATLLEMAQKSPVKPLSENSSKALYSLAHEFYRNAKYNEAKQFFKYLTVANPFEESYWVGLAACCHMLEDYKTAIEHYSIAALQNPNNPYTHWHAAECFFADNNLDQAKTALESALHIINNNKEHKDLLPQLDLLNQRWKSIVESNTGALS